MTDKDRIKELEQQLKIKDGIIETLKDILLNFYLLQQPSATDKEGVLTIRQLVNFHADDKDMADFLMKHLSEERKDGVIQNLMESFKKKEIEALNLRSICSDFTNSEIEICQLILRGKTTTDICNMLGKTRPNISSQRTHIRKKLGLKTSDDLRTALMMRLDLLGD